MTSHADAHDPTMPELRSGATVSREDATVLPKDGEEQARRRARLKMVLELVADSPDEPMPRYMAGNELLNLGEPEPALEHLRRYVEMLPGGDVGAAYRLIGRAHAQLGEPEGAREAYAEGIRAALRHGHGDLAEAIRQEVESL